MAADHPRTEGHDELAARRLRSAVLELSLSQGQPVQSGTVDMVLDAGRWLTGCDPRSWTGEDFHSLGWYGVVAWCRGGGRELPDDAAAALRLLAQVLDPMARHGLLDALAGVDGPCLPSARAMADEPA